MALKKNPKYDIKRKYYRVLQISFILSISMLILAFKFFPDVEFDKLDVEPEQTLITSLDIPITEQKPELLQPPKPLIPIEAPTDDILDDVEIESTELNLNEKMAPPSLPKEVKDEVEQETFIFIVVEEMPEPVGGVGEIQKKIVYPEIAKRAGIEGRVYVKAFVDEAGNVFKVELVKGIGGGCDEAAMSAVSKSLFKPGKQRGKAVKVQVVVPILFKLQNYL